MQPAEFPGFRRLFNDLLSFCLIRRVPFHDSEDLVGSTIESALQHFHPARGAFRSLCFKTLANRIKNYWRDRKPNAPIPDGVDPVDPDWEKEYAWEKRDEEKSRLEAIMAELTEDEKEFLVQLREVYDELEDRAVSEASRRMGIEPQKGWDIFRRIQRKALKVQPGVPYEASISTERAMSELVVASTEQPSYKYKIKAAVLLPEIRSLAELSAIYAAIERFIGAHPEASASAIESYL